MSSKKRVAFAAGAVASVAAFSMVVAPAANAACGSGNHCVYRDVIDDNHERQLPTQHYNFTQLAYADNGGTLNDTVSAARNKTSSTYRSVYLYHAHKESVRVFCVNPGKSVAGLPGIGSPGDGLGQNDEASALKLNKNGRAEFCYG